ncbi:MAG: hypothetical protein MRY32_04570 [Rickettsiales bacterium]|nr:hypothetical protein [Rickettsiales bacterium]
MTEKRTLGYIDTSTTTVAGQRNRIIATRTGAEITNVAGSLGAIMLARELVDKGPLSGVREFVADHVVRPYLDTWKHIGGAAKSIQTKDDTERLKQMNKQDQSRFYADLLIDYSAGFIGGAGGQIGGQMIFDDLASVPNIGPKNHAAVYGVDKAAQIGSIFLLNTALSKPSEQMQKSLAGVMQKSMGFDEESAKKNANFLVNFQIPNFVGAAAAVMAHLKISRNFKWN